MKACTGQIAPLHHMLLQPGCPGPHDEIGPRQAGDDPLSLYRRSLSRRPETEAACSSLHGRVVSVNSIPLIPACTARPGLPLSPPEIAFLESPYYRPQTASIADRHHQTNFHSVTYTQNDDAAFEAGSDNDHKSFLRMRVIFKVEYPAENVLFSSSFGRHSFEFRRVLTAARQQWTLNSDSELDFDGFVTVEFGENGRFAANLAPETMLIHFFFFSTGMPDVNSDSSDADSASVAMSLTATIL